MAIRSVAVACQGGGTHGAFSWGVLDEILRTKKQWDADGRADRFDLTAITGTSNGALSALMVWYGFAPKTNRKGSGTVDEAIHTLDHFFKIFAAREPIEIWHNAMSIAALRAKEQGVPLPGINPYGVLDDILLAELALLGARKEYIDFHALLEAACPDFDKIDWPRVTMRAIVGASEIISGAETTFDTRKKQEDDGIKKPIPVVHEWRRREPFRLAGVVASGTLPTLVEAAKIGGDCYWDGLYSQNPPIRELVAGPPKSEIPDEIWIVRINPQNISGEPAVPENIRDRENELTGNLSLNKELDFINFVNGWLKKYANTPFAADKKEVTLRTIKMNRDTAWSLKMPSKMDRSAHHMNALRQEGIKVAHDWLTEWPHNVGTYPADAGYPK